MNPYRENIVAITAPRRKRLTSQRKSAGILFAIAAAHGAAFAFIDGTVPWIFRLCVGLFILGVVLTFAGRSRSPIMRLSAILWSRGDRFGATMLFLGVIRPTFSAKRLERNRVALERAQIDMPKHHGF